MEATMVIVSILLGGLILLFLKLYNVLVMRPKSIRSKLEKQGIKGPSPSFLYGNIPEIKKIYLHTRSSTTLDNKDTSQYPSHDWALKSSPHIVQWANQYGRTFMYSNGNMVILSISDPELVKELTLQTSLNLGKPTHHLKDMGALFGQGILTSNGPYWVHQRNIMAPELYLGKIKDMVTVMGKATMTMLQSWENEALKDVKCAEIKVDDHLRSLSADIISRACFGSSYTQGEMIFRKIRTLQGLIPKANAGISILRYLPRQIKREISRLEKETNSMILGIVKARSKGKCEKDLLQALLEAAERKGDGGDIRTDIDSNRFIVDNCKNIYFAGYETTAATLSWCLMLLATNPKWQERARAEVFDICGDTLPDATMLPRMKTLTMVIQEALRLYPTAAIMARETLEDMHFKDIHIPKGVILHIPRMILNHDADLWGPDVHQFNPERFREGASKACRIPQVHMPFGAGPRICLGQHFAMAEMKVALSMILARFSFNLSTKYTHSPVIRLTVEPEQGVYLNISRV